VTDRGSRALWVPGLTLALFVLVGIVWKVRTDWSDPQAVLTRFLEARYASDTRTVYEHLCAADHATLSFERFERLYGVSDSAYVAPILERSTFEIEQLEVEGASARARVLVREPVMEIAMNRLLRHAFASAAEGGSPGAMDAALERRARRLRVPMDESIRRFALVRDGEAGWRVDLRLRVREEVDRLMLQASRSAEADALEAARELYERALALDDTRPGIRERLEDVEFRMLPAAEQARRQREAVDAALARMRAERERRLR